MVKVFHNAHAHPLLNLARAAGAPDRSALPIAGDDPAWTQAQAVDGRPRFPPFLSRWQDA
ncbi:hypothetical protein GCM10018780_45790 [Streptomyces lanatus]|nr:hypothetical protein GCM10018780_45790 [Streptomyces lanatus]